MRGMVLAAGLGTRLRPLSREIPKPVVPVLGNPLCGYALEFLRECGVTRFLLNLHHRPEIVRRRIEEWTGGRGISVDFVVEPDILGTGGALWNAREFLGAGTSVVANGDAIVRFPFPEALAFHRERGALATMVLFPDPKGRYTPVGIDGEGRLSGFGEAARNAAAGGFFTGVQIVEPEFLDRIPHARASCVIRETYASLIGKNAPVHGYLTEGTFREFGTPADYFRGTLALLAERTPPHGPSVSATPPGITPPVFLGEGVAIPPSARVGPRAVVETGAVVEEECRVRNAILWPGARIRKGSAAEGMIVTASGVVFPAAENGLP